MEQIKAKREEFWNTRVEGDAEIWQTLRAAVEEPDSATAEAIVSAVGLTIVNNVITSCYDNTGVRYDIPTFIVNDPLKCGEEGEEMKPKVQSAKLALKFRVPG